MREERISVLRTVEASCYGICLFMLREEQGAAKAAQLALLDLYRDEEFWKLLSPERETRIRRLSTSRALEWSAGH